MYILKFTFKKPIKLCYLLFFYYFQAAKGKQATKGQKQIVAENKSTLQFYRNMALIANAIYFLSSFFLFDIFTFKQMVIIL